MYRLKERAIRRPDIAFQNQFPGNKTVALKVPVCPLFLIYTYNYM